MKLPIIIAAGTLTTAIAYNAYALTCGAQPSCDSLGYKYTGATTDCLNEPLKCPFNSSYFNCVKKVDAVNLLVPNYNRGVTLSANGTTYTVGSGNLASYSCGWVLFENYATSAIDNAESDWYINNVIVGRQTAGTPQKWTDFNTGIYFVNKGDTFKNVGKAGINKLTFFPCKGF